MEKLNNWSAFGSEYLKAVDVLSDTDEYVIVNVSSKEETRNNVTKDVLHLHLEKDGNEKLFGCNATNTQAIQEAFPSGPKDSIGAIITFNKAQVTNPQTKQIVDGLRLQVKPKELEDSDEDKELEDSGVLEDGTM